jgi:signal transduction histidine kinase
VQVGPINLRSLRLRAVVVVVVVSFAPVALVAIASWLEGLTARELVVGCERVASALAGGDAGAQAKLAADEADAWVRVVSDDGTVLANANADDGHERLGFVGGFFFGPEGAPRLASWDEAQPPLIERPEVRLALAHGQDSGCVQSPGSQLLVCYGVARVTAGDQTAVVHVEQSRPRAIRALYDLRYQLLKLTLLVLPGAILLAWWLGWRMVLPVEKLRRQVDRHVEVASREPQVKLRRNDAFGDLAQAFNGLLARIEERSRQNEAFVADLAHEFKNPVAAIRAAAESLERGAVDEQRAQRLSRILRDSSVRLDGLVTALLDLARAEAGMVGEERERVDIAELMQRLVDVAREDERHEGITFTLTTDGASVVEGVVGRLETAARNLLENAASYASDGGGRVDVRVAHDRQQVVLEVVDDGPGIPAEHQSRLFERFFTTRSEGRGTGLGLALVKAVVEAHGGRIEVSSAEGQGATFRMLLPSARRAA